MSTKTLGQKTIDNHRAMIQAQVAFDSMTENMPEYEKQQLTAAAMIPRCPRCGVPSPSLLTPESVLCQDCREELERRDGCYWFATLDELSRGKIPKVEKVSG